MAATASPSNTDRVEEQIVLRAPRARVWRALTNADELGAWFGMNIAGQTIAPGADVVGHFVIPGYEWMKFNVTIDEVVPETRFSWRWHPSAIDPKVDYSSEPRTLVTFTLEDAPNGSTLLRVVESGFDRLSDERRAVSLLGNGKGWNEQLQRRLPRYLETA